MDEHAVHDGMSRGARRAVIVLFVITFALAAGNLIFSSGQVNHLAGVVHEQDAQARAQDATIARLNAAIAQQRRQQLTSCNAAADLGTAILPGKPGPSRFAVKIVTDNRAQWYGLGCGPAGSLPVPPGLAAAAARYGIPVNGKES